MLFLDRKPSAGKSSSASVKVSARARADRIPERRRHRSAADPSWPPASALAGGRRGSAGACPRGRTGRPRDHALATPAAASRGLRTPCARVDGTGSGGCGFRVWEDRSVLISRPLPPSNSLIPIAENAESISHVFPIMSSNPFGGSSFFMGTWFPSRGVDPTVPEPRCLPRDGGGLGFPKVDHPFYGKEVNRSKPFHYKPWFLLSDN